MHPIDRIELYLVRMPLIEPWKTAYGSDLEVESVIAEIFAGEAHGWGESCPLSEPTYSPEYAAGAFEVARRFLAPRLVGQVVESGEQLQDLLSAYKGNPFAKAALDTAWWDLHARTLNQPLWRVLGGREGPIDVGTAFGVAASIDALLGQIQRAVDAGYHHVKLKYCRGWDLPVLRAVRKAFPDLGLHIDCNSSYTLDDLPMFQELDRYRLSMIEQPLAYDDLNDHAELQKRIATPVCLDESITSVSQARQALKLGSCRFVNIKPGRVGGITPAKAIHDLCEQAGVPCWVGGMLESSLGVGFMVAMATLPNMKHANDIVPSDKFYKTDLSRPEVRMTGPSRIEPSAAPGVGARPHPDRLAAMCVEHEVVVYGAKK
jgi:O-succinylbenzoate synthase